jgi:hypothetical protein
MLGIGGLFLSGVGRWPAKRLCCPPSNALDSWIILAVAWPEKGFRGAEFCAEVCRDPVQLHLGQLGCQNIDSAQLSLEQRGPGHLDWRNKGSDIVRPVQMDPGRRDLGYTEAEDVHVAHADPEIDGPALGALSKRSRAVHVLSRDCCPNGPRHATSAEAGSGRPPTE